MKQIQINDVPSFNQGLEYALNILRQHYFAGNLEGGSAAIAQIEKMIIPETEPVNGVFLSKTPDFIEEISVEIPDLLARA